MDGFEGEISSSLDDGFARCPVQAISGLGGGGGGGGRGCGHRVRAEVGSRSS